MGATASHALGAAVLAFAAGACARALALSRGVYGEGSDAITASGVSFGGGIDKAFQLALVGLVAIVIKGAGGIYTSFFQARLSGALGTSLRLSVLDGVLSGAGHGDQRDVPSRVAPKVASLTERVKDVQAGLEFGVFGALQALAQIVPIVGVLVLLAPSLALTAIAVLAPFTLLLGYIRRRWKRALSRAAIDSESLLEGADEAVRYADLWTSYGAERKLRNHIEQLGIRIAFREARVRASAFAISGANELLGALALLSALGAAHAGWLRGHAATDPSLLLPFAIVFFLAYRPLRSLAEARLALTRAEVAYDELQEMRCSSGDVLRMGTNLDFARGESSASLAMPFCIDVELRAEQPAAALSTERRRDHQSASIAKIRRRDRAQDRTDTVESLAPSRVAPPWSLETLDVNQLQISRNEVLIPPVSFRLRAGEIAAIVGPTGIGKTTLLRTLLGLESVKSGSIVYGSRELTYSPRGPSARPFAWVPQEAPMLADSLESNIALGSPRSEANMEDVRRLLESLGADYLIESLGQARLGAGGRAVSGGERQWIALARAVATELPILLLDEPTSGLDNESQARVLEAIKRLRNNHSILMVTHRPEPLAIADLVIDLYTATEDSTRQDA